jgi:hypothetical protein
MAGLLVAWECARMVSVQERLLSEQDKHKHLWLGTTVTLELHAQLFFFDFPVATGRRGNWNTL